MKIIVNASASELPELLRQLRAEEIILNVVPSSSVPPEAAPASKKASAPASVPKSAARQRAAKAARDNLEKQLDWGALTEKWCGMTRDQVRERFGFSSNAGAGNALGALVRRGKIRKKEFYDKPTLFILPPSLNDTLAAAAEEILNT